MMEVQDLGGETQRIGDDSKLVGGLVDVSADDGGKVELGSGGVGGGGEVGRKKRGRPPKALPKPPPAKKNKEEAEEEDVCFICFDGGSLVLCDRRCCPKAYHPACIKRDEAFFQSAARWNCGWHICSICQKAAHHMCYTCTYSLCRSCVKKSDYVCVRGDKGFCTICMKMIMLIENNGQGEDGKVQADFDDKLSWEYLFKVYWVLLKGKLSLTIEELMQAKNKSTALPSSLPSTIGVHNRPIEPRSITSSSSTSLDNPEENESKRRKIDETVNTKKTGNNENNLIMAESKDWATKELLDFISHMKNGNTSVLSQFDVQELVTEYINVNNLRDPKRKNQIICDSMLKNLFGKPRVGHAKMLKLLEGHFLVKGDPLKRIVHDHDGQCRHDNMMTVVGKERKCRRSYSKGEERPIQNRLDDFAAVDVYNMNLIYLRRDLMENLLEDGESFCNKVVGSIVRIRISGSDLKHDMYRLVQVVGTSKVEVPYKIDRKLVNFMLEVLNLDKKETISIDSVSDEEFTEEECKRLQQSIQCGLVNRFTVGEIQEKAVALQPVKLNDWMEKEILRLNHARNLASEKGQKKNYRECVEKLQLLNVPEERERRLQEVPVVHSDPKMNPHYESDDTEEYFNKEHGDHMESKYSRVKNSRPSKRRARKKNHEQPKNQTTATEPTTLETLAPRTETEITKSQTDPDSKSDHQTTTVPKTTNDAALWHYLDPNGKVQGPFSVIQLQRWSTTGYFPPDMRIWANHEDEPLLLTDVLKEHLQNHDQTSVVQSSTTTVVTPNEKLSDSHGSSGQSFGQNWSCNPNTANMGDVKDTDVAILDLPDPTSKKMDDKMQSKILIQDSGNPLSWSSASSLVVGGPKIPVSGASSNPVKREEWDSGLVSVSSFKPIEIEMAGDTPTSNIDQNIQTPTSNIDQNINTPNSNIIDHHVANDVPTWNGVNEMIEFSTLAEESVSDLLAEVDAMESQYGGIPSPTSRRNSFVDDLFNGSFDEFSPTPDQGTRSDGFSSSGDIQLPCQSTTTTDEHLVGAVKTSIGLQLNSFITIPQSSGGFKWPEMEQEMIDINRSAKAEGEEGGEMVMKTMVKVKVESGNYVDAGGFQPMGAPKTATLDKKEEVGKFILPEAPQLPPSLTLGLDPFDFGWEPENHPGQGRIRWDPNLNPDQRRYGGDSSNRKQSSSGSGSGSGSGGGSGYLKGQRVCKFYESGRCRKGASCKYLHP